MGKEITSIREALMHEALNEIDSLIEKISTVDASLSKRIELATKEAVDRSCHVAQANFKSLIEEREGALLAAGRGAATIINAQFNSGITQLITASEALERKIFGLIVLMLFIASLGGAIGGVVVAKMLGH
ncbi:hypothetical protein AAKU67_004403 [Oxalobacteraceae bacterium GrIS 2.11]